MRLRPTVVVILVAVALGPGAGRALAQAATGPDDYQTGLYLQHTRGDLPGALEAYRRVAAMNGLGAAAVQALLRQAECLAWSGQQHQQAEVVSALRAGASPLQQRLGPAASFPAESDFFALIDLQAARLTDWLAGLRIEIEPSEPGRGVDALVAVLGVDPRRALRRVALAASWTGDEQRPVDHWVALLEGDWAGLRPDALETLLRGLAAVEGEGSLEVELEDDDRGALLRLRRRTCCPKAGPETPISIGRLELHGHQILLANTGPGQPPANQIGLARLGERDLLVGERRALEATLAGLAGQAVGLRANPRLWQLAAEIPTDAAFFLVLSPGELMRQVQRVQGALGWGDFLPGLSGLVVHGRRQEGLRLALVAYAPDAESARTLTDLARGGLALLRVAAIGEEDPRLARMVEGLRIELDSLRIKLDVQIPEDLLVPPQPAALDSPRPPGGSSH